MRDSGDNNLQAKPDFDTDFELARERGHEALHWRQVRGTSIGIMLTHLAFLRNRLLAKAGYQRSNLEIVQECINNRRPIISATEYQNEILEWEFEIADINSPTKKKWISHDKLLQGLLTSNSPCADPRNATRLREFIADFEQEFSQLLGYRSPFGEVEVDLDPLAAASPTISEKEMQRFFLAKDRPSLVDLLEFSAVINEIGHALVFELFAAQLVGRNSAYFKKLQKERFNNANLQVEDRLRALRDTSYLSPLKFVSSALMTNLEFTADNVCMILAIGMCIDVALNPSLPPASASRFGTYITLNDFDAVGRLGIILSKNRANVLRPKFDISLEGAARYRSEIARKSNLTWSDQRAVNSMPDAIYAEYLRGFDCDGAGKQPWAQGTHGLFLVNSLIYEGLLRLKRDAKLGYLSDDIFGFSAKSQESKVRIAHILSDPEIHSMFSSELRYLVPVVQLHKIESQLEVGSAPGWHEETLHFVLRATSILDSAYDIVKSGEVSFLRGAPYQLSQKLDELKKIVYSYYGVV